MIEGTSTERLERLIHQWFNENDVDVHFVRHTYSFDNINTTNKTHYYTVFIYYNDKDE